MVTHGSIIWFPHKNCFSGNHRDSRSKRPVLVTVFSCGRFHQMSPCDILNTYVANIRHYYKHFILALNLPFVNPQILTGCLVALDQGIAGDMIQSYRFLFMDSSITYLTVLNSMLTFQDILLVSALSAPFQPIFLPPLTYLTWF